MYYRQQVVDTYVTDDEMDCDYMSDDHDDFDSLADELSALGVSDRPTTSISRNDHGIHFCNDPAEFDDLMDYDDLEQLKDDKVDGFPEEYSFLLTWDRIDERNLKNRPALYDLIANQQTTVDRIIKKEIAMVCLLWAQSFIDCRTPLMEDARLTFSNFQKFNPEKEIKDNTMCRVFFTIPLIGENQSNGRSRQLKRGTVVAMKGAQWRETGSIFKADQRELKVVIRQPFKEVGKYQMMYDEPISLYEVPQEFVPLAMLNSIIGMSSGLLNHFIIPQPKFRETADEFVKRRDENKQLWINTFIPDHLTPDQQDAVFTICNKEHGDQPFVLHGPPGTGKTCTIAATIEVLMQMNNEHRILICTPSNMAADRVAEKLMSKFGKVMNERNVLRLRSTGNDYTNRDRAFDSITARDPNYEQFIIPKSYEAYKVVVCTLGCSSHLMRVGVKRGFFTHIIIDEAGQCSEAEIWIPIGGLAEPNTSVILCGDPKQLGPVITLDFSPRLTKSFQSPLSRYKEMRPYKTDPRMCILLSKCFRCPRPLVILASNLFYSSDLKYSGDHETFDLDFSAFGPPKDFPLMFISVDSQEVMQPNGFSYGNKLEADIILKYTEIVIKNTDIQPQDIGIISPYRYQNRLICDQMRQHRCASQFKKVTVDTVERFQGSERACILISTVRSNDLGFVKDDLRVNTSLTRAQHLLIVVGNEDALQRHPSWRVFINYTKKYGGYKQWDYLYNSVL
ncbi:hypothetical protein M3Y94_01283800 [Aphelenchoides besseyi]|nr:hypothetical protein M3Y94_01283800 [Aphelenchoides besseyi]KAI6222765.1 putative RNA helicase SDE3 [Aphelenchoides besseyi]